MKRVQIRRVISRAAATLAGDIATQPPCWVRSLGVLRGRGIFFRQSSDIAALLSDGLMVSVTPALGQTDPQRTVATVLMWAALGLLEAVWFHASKALSCAWL